MKSVLSNIKKRWYNYLTVVAICAIVSNNFYSYAESKNDKNNSLEETIDKMSIDEIKVLYDKSIDKNDLLTQTIAGRKIGEYNRNNSKFREAIDMHRLCLELATEINDTIEIIKNLNNLGTDFRRIGAFSEASEYHNRALSISTKCVTGDKSQCNKGRAVALNGIGNISLTLGYFNDAKRCFQQALQVENTLNNKLGFAINYANIGLAFEGKQNYDSALVCYKKSMTFNEIIGSQIGISLCHTYIGKIYEIQGEYEEAQHELLLGYEVMADNSDEWHKLNATTAIARFYLRHDQLEKAYKFVLEAQKMAQAIGAAEFERDAYILMYEYYKKCNNAKLALKYLEISQSLSDSIMSSKQSDQFMELRYQCEQERTNSAISKLSHKTSQESRLRMITITGASILVAIMMLSLLIVYNYLKVIRKRNNELQKEGKLKNKLFSIISSNLQTPLEEQLKKNEEIINDFNDKDRIEIKETLLLIRHYTKNQQTTLLNLTTWALINTNQFEVKIGRVDISRLLNKIVIGVKNTTDLKRIIIDIRLTSNNVLQNDSSIVEFILLNIISNAVKFTNSGGIVRISSRTDDDFLYLSIADNGIGIDKQMLENIFELGEKNNGRLGLPICKKMAEYIGGKISISCGERKGTTVEIAFKRDLTVG